MTERIRQTGIDLAKYLSIAATFGGICITLGYMMARLDNTEKLALQAAANIDAIKQVVASLSTASTVNHNDLITLRDEFNRNRKTQ